MSNCAGFVNIYALPDDHELVNGLLELSEGKLTKKEYKKFKRILKRARDYSVISKGQQKALKFLAKYGYLASIDFEFDRSECPYFKVKILFNDLELISGQPINKGRMIYG